MGFLLGVLESVKDDEAVKTYDKDISTGDLNSVIKKLEDNIGTGRTGLVASVEQVKGWLEGYWTQVDKKKGQFINDIEAYKNMEITAHIATIDASQHNGLQVMHTAFNQSVSQLGEKIAELKANNEGFAAFDKVLKCKLEEPLRSIEGAVDVLIKSTGNKMLADQAKFVDETLDTEKRMLETKIKEESEEVKKPLYNAFADISKKITCETEAYRKVLYEQKEIIDKALQRNSEWLKNDMAEAFSNVRISVNSLKNTKDGYFNDIKKKLEEAQNFVEKDFDKTYRSNIVQKFNELKGLMNKIDPNVPTKSGTESELKKKFNIVTQNAMAVDNLYKERLKKVKQDVDAAVENALSEKDHGLNKLDDHVKHGLQAVRQKMISQLKQFGNSVLQALKAGVQGAQNWDGTSGTLGLSALAIQLKAVGLIELEEKIRDVGIGNISLAKAMEGVLARLEDDYAVYKRLKSSIHPKPSELLDTLKRELSTAIEGQFQRVIPNVDSAIKLDGLMQDYYERTKTGINPGKLRAMIDGIKDHVNHDGFKTTKQAADFDPDEMNGYKHTNIGSGDDDNKGAKSLLDTATKDVDAIIAVLQGLPTEVDTKKSGMQTKMDELKQQISYKIDVIRNEITASDSALDVSIQALRKTFYEADNAAMQAVAKLKGQLSDTVALAFGNATYSIDGLQKQLIDTVTDAFNICQEAVKVLQPRLLVVAQSTFSKITYEVHSLFAEGQKSDLKALQQLIGTQLETIKEIINDYMKNGVKGLLRNFNDFVIYKFQRPTITKNTKIGELFERMREGFEEFVGAVMNQTDMFRDVLAKLKDPGCDFDQVQKQFPPPLQTVKSISEAVDTLLSHLCTSQHYDYNFSRNLNTLKSALSTFTPTKFGERSSPILQAFKDAISGLAKELGKAYVNRYSGKTFGELVKNSDADKMELTPEGRNVAKAFLTLLNTVYEDLTTLNTITATYCKTETLCLNNVGRPSGSQSLNPLGDYFHQRGYKVPSKQNTQDGELQYKTECNGRFINRMLLNKTLENVTNIEEHLKACEANEKNQRTQLKKDNNFNIFDLLRCIYHHVDKYNEVCHLATFNATRSPCSVYEMLIWLSGLTHSGVHPAMVGKTFLDLLRDPAKEAKLAAQDNDGEEPTISFGASDPIALDAYPKNIEFVRLDATLTHICSKAYDVICTIVGTGDEYTTYGCDYSNNSFKLKYPSDPAACFDMLLDILRRLLPALRYIFQRCNVTAEHHGWRNCEYGKDVPTSKSHCTNKATGQVTGQPNSQPTCEAKCQPISPLMSYLNDCLPGHLPHSLTDIGCKAVCSNCPSAAKLGMPCLTPMGFRGFSVSTKTGADLCEIIREFLGSGLVSSLLGLSPTPPKTLPEHFGFVRCLVDGMFATQVPITNRITQRMESSITKQTIRLYEQPNKLTETLRDVYASRHTEVVDKPHLPAYADLSSLYISVPCSVDGVQCAPYLSSLACDNYNYLAHKNAATYLSWAVYLPWDFWTQLNNLCTAFKNIFCQDWGCHTCLRADKCKRGQHGLVEQKEGEPAKPHCKCPSMVQCKGVSATLYQFGFCFGNAATLNSAASPKTCSDFCTQLDKVLKSEYFVKLFTECDNYIWTIREPFTYLVLALWSLSLFYLICVMVGRLDVLHIRSHLRIPSSHKITAQSLLAAAQVGRLAKIWYLQP